METVKRYEEARGEQIIKRLEIERLEQEVLQGDSVITLPYSIEGQSDPILSNRIGS